MKLGDYYDSVLAESEKLAEAKAVEQAKVAEAIEILGENDETAVNELIENDYAEKVAGVMTEFDIDQVSFENDTDKVASAMEIVDGWEKIAMKGERYVKSFVKGIKKIIQSHPKATMVAGSAGAGATGGAATRVLERDKKNA
jgi:hypothetical protein